MKLLLTIVIFLLFATSVWAQQQTPTIVYEKRQGKIMRIVKYRTVDVVSEKSFTIPPNIFNEESFYRLDRQMTSYNKNEMIKLVSSFMKRNRKQINLEKLKYFSVTCYFNKSTFELEEITYSITSGLINRYSILRELTNEIKNERILTINKKFTDRIGLHNPTVEKMAFKYFELYYSIWDSDFKPY